MKGDPQDLSSIRPDVSGHNNDLMTYQVRSSVNLLPVQLKRYVLLQKQTKNGPKLPQRESIWSVNEGGVGFIAEKDGISDAPPLQGINGNEQVANEIRSLRESCTCPPLGSACWQLCSALY